MFDELFNLPAHPLIVHAAVIFVPLQALAAAAYALIPKIRSRIDWLVVGLSVIAPVAAYAAKLSGQALRQRLINGGLRGQSVVNIDQHAQIGDRTILFSVVLTLFAIGMVWLVRTMSGAGEPSRGLTVGSWALTFATVVAAILSTYFVVRSGHTGASMVWGNT